MRKLFITGSTALLLSAFSLGAFAQCASRSNLQADAQFPALRGRLVYHTYSSYGDGTSRLFLYDFQSRTLSQLSNAAWNILDPMNAQFSPDGKRIVFMGIQNDRWHVFLWTPGSAAAPVNLTQSIGGNRNEDPKFSFDGKRIVYKQDGNIRIMELDFSNPATVGISNVISVTSGSTYENSMPHLTPSGKYVLYTRGANATFDIYRTNLETMQTEQVGSKPGLADYYPIVRDQSTYFFTRWKDAQSQNDQVYMRVPNLPNDEAIELKLNVCGANNSDASPVDEDFLVFSSTRGDSVYNLYLGDIKTGQVWSLNQFGINALRQNKLGANYTLAR